MERLAFLLVPILILGCKPKVKDVFLHTVPSTGEVMAGNTIDMVTTTYPVIKTAQYKWSVKAKCKVAVEGKGPKVTLRLDKYCPQHDATVTVTVTANGKSVSKTKKFSILEASDLPPRLSLKPDMKGWLVINDYNASDRVKANNLKAPVSTWSMDGGICKAQVENGVLKIAYTLPGANSLCGTMDYFAGEPAKPQPYDITKYDRLSVKLKSGDGKRHKIKVIIVEYDPYQTANQGLVGEKTLTVLEDRWWRYELSFKYTLPELFDRKRAKGIGLKIQGQEGEKGVILVDDLALIPKK